MIRDVQIISPFHTDSLDHQVVTVDDDTDIDELIEMDDSDRDHSDNDLFMSPPPLSLSQDHVAETASKQPTQTGKQLCSRAKDIGCYLAPKSILHGWMKLSFISLSKP